MVAITHVLRLARPDLVLPDGRCLDDMRYGELYRALMALGIPGVTPDETKTELMDLYAAHMAAQRGHHPSQLGRVASG